MNLPFFNFDLRPSRVLYTLMSLAKLFPTLAPTKNVLMPYLAGWILFQFKF